MEVSKDCTRCATACCCCYLCLQMTTDFFANNLNLNIYNFMNKKLTLLKKIWRGTIQTPYARLPQSHNAFGTEALQTPRMPQQDGVKKEREATKSFKNMVSKWQQSKTNFPIVPLACPVNIKVAPLKQPGMKIKQPNGWSDFEIILLLSRMLASNRKRRAKQSTPKMTLETRGSDLAGVNPWRSFPYIKRSVKMSRAHTNQTVSGAG